MLLTAVLFCSQISTITILENSVDRRLAGSDAWQSLYRFLDYPSNAKKDTFVINPVFWAKDVDLSCASPWNSLAGALRAGALISKRHFVCAKHFPFRKGARILFVDSVGNVCPCEVESVKALEGIDIMVGLLNAEVTPDIRPTKILPPDYAKYIGDGKGLPVATFNHHEQLVVSNLLQIPTNRFMRLGSRQELSIVPYLIRTSIVENGIRSDFCKILECGDSGNPAFLFFGNEPILLFCNTCNNAGGGPPLHLFRREIQWAMDDLCPGYKLEEFDFEASGKPD